MTSINQATQTTQIKKHGRPINPACHLPDGSVDPNYYFKIKYHKPHTCEFCGKTRKCSDNVARHQRSARCAKARAMLEQTQKF